MKTVLLLILLLGCAARKFYQGPEVAQELRINEAALGLVMVNLQTDFETKQNYFHEVKKKTHDKFIMQSLNLKFRELEETKEMVLRRTAYLKGLNGKLLDKVSEKEKIREGEPAFEAIESFASKKVRQLEILQKEYANYEKTAEEFENLAFYTRMVKN